MDLELQRKKKQICSFGPQQSVLNTSFSTKEMDLRRFGVWKAIKNAAKEYIFINRKKQHIFIQSILFYVRYIWMSFTYNTYGCVLKRRS